MFLRRSLTCDLLLPFITDFKEIVFRQLVHGIAGNNMVADARLFYCSRTCGIRLFSTLINVLLAANAKSNQTHEISESSSEWAKYYLKVGSIKMTQ